MERPHQDAIENNTNDNTFYARQRVIEDHIQAVRQSIEAKQTVWIIEYIEKKEGVAWRCEDAFTLNHFGDHEDNMPLHRMAYNCLYKVRDDHEAERLEDRKIFWRYENDLIEKKQLQEMCDRIYPQRQWRIRLVNRGELQKLYPGRFVRYAR